MANLRPFSAVRYPRRPDLDLSSVISPPFDVIDEALRAKLQARHPHNIVHIDLPHIPPKAAGPDELYQKSSEMLRQWLDQGVLVRDGRPALYPYMQTYEHDGKTYRRRGFFALVKIAPFGEGDVVPHEKTYRGAIEDRLKLMHATGMQLSPIFGLYDDPRNQVSDLLYQNLLRPEQSATIDGIRNDLWSVIDADTENAVIDAIGTRSIYIADGHHRYTTALQYKADLEKQNGGPLPEAHPANWCMFVLISMQDDGLLILPTHRLIGNLRHFDIDIFRATVSEHFDVAETPLTPQHVDEYARDVLPKQPPHTFGLYCARTRKLYQLRLRDVDILEKLEPNQSQAWRRLDVAILQRYLLDEVIQPRFAGSQEITKGYTADPNAIVPLTDGHRYDIALIIQSTPLQSLVELGRHNEVMPQKSTFFYPKLMTGMVINPLR